MNFFYNTVVKTNIFLLYVNIDVKNMNKYIDYCEKVLQRFMSTYGSCRLTPLQKIVLMLS